MIQEAAPEDVSGFGRFAHRSRSPPLRIRLLLLVVVCILPLFAFGFGNAYFDYQVDRAGAGQKALEMTRTLSLLVQRDLEARLAILQVLALSDRLKVDDLVGFRALAEAVVAEQQPGSNILLLREDGQQVMNTALPPDAPLPVRHDTTSLQRLFTTAQPSVSDIFIGAAPHRPVIALEVPVRGPDGRVLYSLALNPTVDAFAEIVHRQHLNTGWIVSIFDRQGVLVARAPDNPVFVGKMAGPVLLPLLLTQSEGVVENTSQDGVPVVSAFSHVPSMGWSVAIGLPQAEFVDPAKRAAWVTFGVGMACLVLGLGLAHAMARRIAKPIASLQELSIALEQDNPNIPIATGIGETDEVAQALIAASRKRKVAETTSRQAEREREQAASLLRTVIETTPSLIYAKDRAGQMVLANGAFLEVIGRTWADVVGRTDHEFRDDQVQAEAVVATDHRIMANGETEASEEVIRSQGRRTQVWFSTKTPLRNMEMEVIGLVSVMVDITERKQVEDRLRQMVNELNHRVKNTLASVQAIASHTLRGADQTIQRALEGRLMALASAHDVLTREQWVGASLTDVVAGALMPYGGMEDDRFQVAGPPLRLQPRAAVALAMGLHELATNALKYGAMSVDQGKVELSWAVVEDHPPRLRMIWSEQGGPPVIAPVKRGFGTRLIERSLAHDLAGTAQITFTPKGVICLIDALLSEVVATAEVMVLPQVGGNQKWH